MKVLKNKKIMFILPIIILFLIVILLIPNSGSIYKEELNTNVDLNINNSEYRVVFNGNGSTSGTTESITCEYTVNCKLTSNGFLKTGYTFAGWATSANGEKVYNDGEEVLNLVLTGDYPLYAKWIANELIFENQLLNQLPDDNSSKSVYIVEARNGTGEYTYTEKSEINSNSENTNYFSLNGTTITIQPSTPEDTYTVVITATDDNSGVSKDAIYTIVIGKLTPTITLTEKTGMVYTGGEQVANIATVTPETGEEVSYTYYTDNACTIPYNGPVCKRASELHEATCSYACQAHLSNGALIEFGNLGSGESLMPGDAFDCDVNYDGIYDKDTERFYYVTSHGNEAVLLYYTNTLNGELADVSTTSVPYATQESATNLGYSCDNTSGCNYYGPLVAYTHLPSITQWKNPGLTMVSDENSRTRQITNESGNPTTNNGNSSIESFTYTNKAARLLTLQELVDGCPGLPSNRTYTSGELNGCNYVLENTSYDISQGSIYGFWLETPQSTNLMYIWAVFGQGARYVASTGANSVSGYGARPAITVQKSNIELSTEVSNIPKNANNYYVKASISGTENYNNAESACIAHTIAKSNTTTTLSAITNEYNGTSQVASGATSTLNSNNSTITGAEYTYTYYEGTSCDGIALASAPTNIGEYRVKATLTGTNNYNSSTSSCTVYTMEPTKITITINKGGVPWSNSGVNVALYQNDTEVYGYSSAIVNGATVTFTGISSSNLYNVYISKNENNLTTLMDSGVTVGVLSNTNATINFYQLTFNANTGEYLDTSTTKTAIYYFDNYRKYSHTSNVDDTGLKISNYDNNWTNANIRGTNRTSSNSQAHVVTIPGASSITVDLYYNGESTSWDWVSVWAGNYPSYTAASNYSSTGAVTTAMGGLSTNKYGGNQSGSYTVNGNSLTNMGHTTLTIPGDTVTFGFKSDGSGYGQGYGYYAKITGIGLNMVPYSGIYEEPKKEYYEFVGWNTESAGSGITYKDEVSLLDIFDTSLTLYAQLVAKVSNFKDQIIEKTYNKNSSQTIDISEVSNITENYTYSIKSEKNSSNTNTNYISIDGNILTIKADTPVDTYNVVITALDENINVSKDAIYTIVIKKATPIVTLLEKIGMVYTGSEQIANTATVTPEIDEEISYNYYSDSSCTIPYEDNKKICRRAKTLHSETCYDNRCYIDEDYQEGSNEPITFIYGNLGTSEELISGDAFDCDVNNDGIYDSNTERFYYVSSEYDSITNTFDDSKAVLIYYSNVSNQEGSQNVSSTQTTFPYSSLTDIREVGTCSDTYGCNWYGPLTAIKQLPTITQWSNPQIMMVYDESTRTRQIVSETAGTTTNNGEYDLSTFSYTNKAARLLTYQEVQSACGTDIIGVGTLKNCRYLMEKISIATSGAGGHWLENPQSTTSVSALGIHAYLGVGDSNGVTSFGIASGGVRPAITVLKSNIDTSLNQVPSLIPSNAGTHYVKAKVEETRNYNSAESSCVAHTIAKSDTTTTLNEIIKRYNGKVQPASGASSIINNNGEKIDFALYTYTYYEGSGCDGIALATAPSEAGEYSVIARLTEDRNYNSSYSSCTKYTINPLITPTISLNPRIGMMYTGESQTANTAIVSPESDGIITYSYYRDSNCTVPATQLASETILRKGLDNDQLNQIPDTDIYIFRGGTYKTPANYIKFNCNNTNDLSTCENWRIIGIYGDKLKIIRVNESGVPTAPVELSQIKYNTTNTNPGWFNSSLYTYLNNRYYKGLTNSAKNMIVDGTWNVGSLDIYNEVALQSYTSSNKITTTGKVGLLTGYELLYATGKSASCFNVKASSYGSNCGSKDNNWISNDVNTWTVSPYSSDSTAAIYLYNSLGIMGVFGEYQAVPAVFLSPNIKIASGDGTFENAYLFDLADTTPPVNAGNYYVKAIVSKTEDYNSAESDCVEHVIQKVTPTINLREKTDLIYTGAVNSQNETVVSNGLNDEVKYNYYSDSSCEVPHLETICRRASELHSEKCTNVCKNDYYSKTTMEYGNLGNGDSLNTGDAFDCDVNQDGKYDPITERFYYVSDYYDTHTKSFDDTTAVLIYYRNFVNGNPSDDGALYASSLDIEEAGYADGYGNWHGPVTAVKHLPKTVENGGIWRKGLLKNTKRAILAENKTSHNSTSTTGGFLPSMFSYEGSAGRLLTVQEVMAGCKLSQAGNYSTGELSRCNFLFESTKYSDSTRPTYSIWLETPSSSESGSIWTARNSYRDFCTESTSLSSVGVRPVIDVPKSNISLDTTSTFSPTVDAGTFFVKASLDEKTNYNATESSCVSRLISKSDTTTIVNTTENTYNGSSLPSTGTSKLSSNNSDILDGSYIFTYYEGTSCDGIALTTAPTEVGEYRVKATLIETNNYNSSTSSCTAYIIKPSIISITINKGGVPWLDSGINVALYQNDTEVYGFNSATVNGATVTFNVASVGPFDIYISKDENNLTTLIDSGLNVEVPTNTDQTINFYQIIFDSNTGVFSNSNTSNSVVYNKIDGVIKKYSHTSNVDDTGKKKDYYGKNWTNANITGTDRGDTTKAHVVTIPGVRSLIVDLYYNGESSAYDWVSVWAGNYPSYTASSNFTSTGAVTTAMGGLSTNRYGGSQNGSYVVNGNILTGMGHTTLTIPGDTVTFGFKSDNSGFGQGYGYYAIIKEGPKIIYMNGTYKEPTKDEHVFIGWNTERDGSGTTYTDEVSLSNITDTNLTLYAQYRIPTATFKTGYDFITIIKQVSGQTSATYTSLNNTITAFTKYAGIPTQEILNNATIVSTDDSDYIIYIWFDNGTIYWYSESDTIYFNANSNYMFYYLAGINTIDLSEFDLSKITSSTSMFYDNTNITTIITPKVNASSSINLPKEMMTSDNTTYSSITNSMEPITTLKVPYTIMFDFNGGVNSSCVNDSGKRVIYPGTPVGPLPSITITKPGYVMNGWQTEQNGGSIVTESTVPTSSTTYYVNFVKNGVFANDIKNNNTFSNVNCESVQCLLEYFTQFREERGDLNEN